MIGRERILASLQHKPTDQVPWVPFAGIHAGKLKGYSAREVLTDANKLFESLLAVNQIYVPDGQPVLFDLQVEAEILGCNLVWSESAPPTVVSHPLASAKQIPDKLPQPEDGRLPLILSTMHRLKAEIGAHTALYGLVCGPFTLASHLRGTEIFMDMFDDADFVHDLLAYCQRVCQQMARLYIDAGMDVIAVVDPMVSQISARHFDRFLTKIFTEIFADIRSQQRFSAFFVCGDATKNIELMCHTNPDSISIDENINLPAAKKITDQHNITIGGNIPLASVMLLGTQQDNMKFVVDLLENVEHHNLIIAPGCDMPYDTPIENVIGVMEAVHNPTAIRQSLANYHAETLDVSSVVLPDYAHLKRPLVEVFTLDSASCAACMYMWQAAHQVSSGLPVDIVEYRFTERSNLPRFIKMGIKNLPAIYINGELKYSSIIPSSEALQAEIQKYIEEH
jgi:uroporphyrinogen decarboxylase